MSLVPVAAMMVGSVAYSYTPAQINKDKPLLLKGAELGCFKFGSTVVILFPPNFAAINPHLREGQEVRMGEEVARMI